MESPRTTFKEENQKMGKTQNSTKLKRNIKRNHNQQTKDCTHKI